MLLPQQKPAKLPTLPNNCMIKQVQHFITLNKELVFAEKESMLPFFIEGIRVDRSIQFVIKLHTKIFVWLRHFDVRPAGRPCPTAYSILCHNGSSLTIYTQTSLTAHPRDVISPTSPRSPPRPVGHIQNTSTGFLWCGALLQWPNNDQEGEEAGSIRLKKY